MQVVDNLSALRTRIKNWRQQGQSIAFVPTMGNLHEGHLSLVKKAQAHADNVVVSIFVNPLQFNDKNDLAHYPRTLEQDVQLLTELDCDLVFSPTESMIYPQGMDEQTRVHVPGMEDKLCGKGRPGHFDGVATVVCKLFNMVQADIAVFGEKDYQQLMMIRKMTQDLNIPVDILSAETCREQNGLAMSSRNQHLSEQHREQASKLYQVLSETKSAIQAGNDDYQKLCAEAIEQINRAGFDCEYFDIRRAEDLLDAVPGMDKALRILVAAKLGTTRLIDNIACDLA